MNNTDFKYKNTLIDLHLHLDGSLSIASVRRLAAMQNIAVPESDEEIKKLLSVSDGCRDLNEYLEKFDFPCSLLQTREAIACAFETLKRELSDMGLIYAEIRFAPQKHCEKGLTQEEVVLAAIEGSGRVPMASGLILCCMRGDDNDAENRETLRIAAKYLDKGVCAADLAGAEAIFKTNTFAELFDYAKSLNLRYTIHAGEADGPESIRAALSYGARRIGHGVRSIEDDKVVAALAEKKIPIETCPTSNMNTAMFESLSDYPIPYLMKKGVIVTVNTDNMSVSNTTVRHELELLKNALGLSDDDIGKLLLNAADAAFCADSVKEMLKQKILEA